jgi:hypothetical protein
VTIEVIDAQESVGEMAALFADIRRALGMLPRT